MRLELKVVRGGSYWIIDGKPRYDIHEMNFEGIDALYDETGLKDFQHVIKDAHWSEDETSYILPNVPDECVSIENNTLVFLRGRKK